MRKIILFIFLLGLSGCGFVFQQYNANGNVNELIGMPKEEVINRLGNPQKQDRAVIKDKEYDIWEYPQINKNDGALNPLGTLYYKVFFLDGRVVQHDESTVFAQPAYEYLETVDAEQKKIK